MIADHGCGDATLKALEPRCVYATFGAKHYHTSHPFHSGGPLPSTSTASSPTATPIDALPYTMNLLVTAAAAATAALGLKVVAMRKTDREAKWVVTRKTLVQQSWTAVAADLEVRGWGARFVDG